tara:strand:+ start:148 stop:357 length:210 start_codon:yes stop_codon:yes gene_type:complete
MKAEKVGDHRLLWHGGVDGEWQCRRCNGTGPATFTFREMACDGPENGKVTNDASEGVLFDGAGIDGVSD